MDKPKGSISSETAMLWMSKQGIPHRHYSTAQTTPIPWKKVQ
jgi:hypothetical protein